MNQSKVHVVMELYSTSWDLPICTGDSSEASEFAPKMESQEACMDR